MISAKSDSHPVYRIRKVILRCYRLRLVETLKTPVTLQTTPTPAMRAAISVQCLDGSSVGSCRGLLYQSILLLGLNLPSAVNIDVTHFQPRRAVFIPSRIILRIQRLDLGSSSKRMFLAVHSSGGIRVQIRSARALLRAFGAVDLG